jgi:hypothetical protein
VDEIKKLLTLHLGWWRELGCHWRNLHPCPLFSSTLEGYIANGRDYSADGVQYNDCTICACGLGTLTDSLVTLKKAVYKEKRMGLEGLRGTGSVTESICSLNRIDFAVMAGNSVLDTQLSLRKLEEDHLAALFRTFGELGDPPCSPIACPWKTCWTPGVTRNSIRT